MKIANHPDTVLIVDFGSQFTQLIARRIREAGVFSEIVPFQSAEAAFKRIGPKAVILSGGPASTSDIGSPRAPQIVFDAGVPVLGICYGQMAMCVQMGGVAESSDHREFGRAFVEIAKDSPLFEGLWAPGQRHQVWMSHGDRVISLPQGFRGARKIGGLALRYLRQCRAQDVRHHVPPGGGAHAGRRPAAQEFRPQHRRHRRRLDDAGLSRARGRDDPQAGRQGQGHLRAVGRRRFLGRGAVDPRGGRRPAHLHPCRPWPDAQGRGRRRGGDVPPALQSAAHPGRCFGQVHLGAGGRGRPREEAQDHRPAVHRGVRGRGQEARRRRFPGARHALSRRHRKRFLHRRPVGDHQVAPQCRRPARAHEHATGRAAARTVQGRGEGARQGARPARKLHRPASVSRARASPSAARAASPAKSWRSCARPTPSISTRSARPGSTTRSGRPSPCCCRCRPSA